MLRIRVLLLLIIPVSASLAIFIGPTDAPVARLIANTNAYIQKFPEIADGYYALARIHYMAFARNSSHLESYPGQQDPKYPIAPPTPYNSFSSGVNTDTKPPRKEVQLTPAERERHLEEALRNFDRALKIDPKNPLYLLGLASLNEDRAPEYREKAIAGYLASYDSSITADLKVGFQPIAGVFLSQEAGSAYLRLVRERKPKPNEAPVIARIESGIADLKKLPRGAITPIILALREASSIDDLLAPGTSTTFDLDGTGSDQRYPWLQPDTAVLVWDPDRTGRIVSGRQLFGSVTWWIFWKNGYRALDALDDNRDGQLAGAELTGLALWFDRNQNGHSDPGEVVPIEQTGIEALSTEITGRDGGSLVSARGVRMKDGRVLRTWDWIVTPDAAPAIGNLQPSGLRRSNATMSRR